MSLVTGVRWSFRGKDAGSVRIRSDTRATEDAASGRAARPGGSADISSSSPMMRAYVGVGANLGNRRRTIERALELLGACGGVEVVAVSTLRETDPVGYTDQPRFLNAAVAVETELEPRELLDVLLGVERELGRTREGPRFGPRTIDLDLLVFGDRQVMEPGLTVPHPRLAERAFALQPLAELDPSLEIPGRGRVEHLLRGLQSS
jgi:2-amino-4-hydroxy-6-hydroxymethyldihydropteridine diphosphokinase